MPHDALSGVEILRQVTLRCTIHKSEWHTTPEYRIGQGTRRRSGEGFCGCRSKHSSVAIPDCACGHSVRWNYSVAVMQCTANVRGASLCGMLIKPSDLFASASMTVVTPYLGIWNSAGFKYSKTVSSLHQPLYLIAGDTSNIKSHERLIHLGPGKLRSLSPMLTHMGTLSLIRLLC